MTEAPPPTPYYQPSRQPYEIGAALSWGWRKFLEHKTVFIVGMLPMLIVTIAFYIAYFAVYFPLVFNQDTYSDGEITDVVVRMGIVVGVFLLLMIPIAVLQANLSRIALVVADGGQPTISMLYDTRRMGRILLTFLTLGAGTLIGTLLCILPGIAFGFLSSFTMLFVVDQDMRVIEAIKASIALVRGHLGLTLLSILLISVIASLGSYACVIGIVASIPISLLMQVYCYRALIQGTVRP